MAVKMPAFKDYRLPENKVDGPKPAVAEEANKKKKKKAPINVGSTRVV